MFTVYCSIPLKASDPLVQDLRKKVPVLPGGNAPILEQMNQAIQLSEQSGVDADVLLRARSNDKFMTEYDGHIIAIDPVTGRQLMFDLTDAGTYAFSKECDYPQLRLSRSLRDKFTSGSIADFQSGLEELQLKFESIQNSLRNRYIKKLEEEEQMFVTMSPKEIEARIKHIAYKFSDVLSTRIVEKSDEIKNTIEILHNINAETVKNTDLFQKYGMRYLNSLTPEENVNNLIGRLKNIDNTLRDYDPDAILETIDAKAIFGEVFNYFKDECDNTENMIKYFDILSEKSLGLIKSITGLSVELVHGGINVEISSISKVTEDNDSQEIDSDEERREEKDDTYATWGTQSIESGLSAKLKRFLYNIPYIDNEGYYEEDEYGEPRYLNGSEAFVTCLELLNEIESDSELIPTLQKYSSRYSWMPSLISALQLSYNTLGSEEEYDSLYPEFYWAMRKDQDILRGFNTERQYGAINVTSRLLNRKEGYKAFIDTWNGNLREHLSTIDSDYSIIYEDGRINSSQVSELRKATSISSTDKKETVVNKLITLCRALGIEGSDSNMNRVFNALSSTNRDKLKTALDKALNIIEKQENIDNLFTGDAIKNLKQGKIAELISAIAPATAETSVRVAGKSIYGHAYPNFLGRIAKVLSCNDPIRVKAFLVKNYMQYPEYCDVSSRVDFTDVSSIKKGDVVWKNNLLQEVWDAADSGKDFDLALQHIASFDDNEYSSFEAKDTALIELESFFNQRQTTGNTTVARFVLPIESDAPSMNSIERKVLHFTERDIKVAPAAVSAGTKALGRQLLNEYDRIIKVKERGEAYRKALLDKKELPFHPIANYDMMFDSKGNVKKAGGSKWIMFGNLDNFKVLRDGTLVDSQNKDGISTEEYIFNIMTDPGISDEDRRGIIGQLALRSKIQDFNKFKEDWEKLGMFDSRTTKDVKGNDKTVYTYFESLPGFMTGVNPKNSPQLFNFYMNHALNTAECIQMLTVDVAFYKQDNFVDFQKRSKEWHAPGQRIVSSILEAKVLPNGSPKYPKDNIGRVCQRMTYIDEMFIPSNTLDDIRAALEKKFEGLDPELKSKLTAVADTYSSHNVNDAQAWRSVDSYLDFLQARGDKNYRAAKKAIDNFTNWLQNDGEKPSIDDWNVICQTWKPFVYSVECREYNGANMPVPSQCKNSEFPILFSLMAKNPAMKDKCAVFEGIDRFMKKNNIHVLQCSSAIKAGLSASLDIEKFADTSYDSDYYFEYLDKQFDESYIKMSPIEDWGIQGATPEHVIDHDQIIGSQIKKLITGIHSKDAIFRTFDNFTMDEATWQKAYNNVLSANYREAFSKLESVFNDKAKLSEELQRMINNSTRYSNELKNAVKLNEKGDFDIDFDSPQIRNDLQMLLLSYASKTLNRQKIRGGACIQVSCMGFSDDLKLVMEGDHVAYMECYMPAYSKKFYEPLMEPDGTLNLDKVDENGNPVFPEELRRAIGYRVPTESYYSMAPLRIKGFLPQQNGSSIMLPAEITTLSGSDFDVDKMYLMLPEFEETDLRYQAAVEELKSTNGEAENEVYNAIQNLKKTERFNMVAEQRSGMVNIATESDEEVVERVMKKWKENENPLLLNPNEAKVVEWYTQTQEDEFGNSVHGDKKRLEYIKYDYSKPALEQSQKARNNALIELMYGALTSSDTLEKFLKPGGFETPSLVSRKCEVARIGWDKISPYAKGANSLYEFLEKATKEDLEAIIKKTEDRVDVLSPYTYTKFHQQNMVGKQMLAIFAVSVSSHALRQHSNNKIKYPGMFSFNGYTPSSLDCIYDREGNYVAENLAQLLAGAADNVKDPTLARMGLTKKNINIATMMIRMGYTIEDVALFMSQPAVKFASENNTSNITFDNLVDIDSLQIDLRTLYEEGEIGKTYDTNTISKASATQQSVYRLYNRFRDFLSKQYNSYTNASKPEKLILTDVVNTIGGINDLKYTDNISDAIDTEVDFTSANSDDIATSVVFNTNEEAVNLIGNYFPVASSNEAADIRRILMRIGIYDKEIINDAIGQYSNFLRLEDCSDFTQNLSFNINGIVVSTAESDDPAVQFELVKKYMWEEFPKVFKYIKKKYGKNNRFLRTLNYDPKSNVISMRYTGNKNDLFDIEMQADVREMMLNSNKELAEFTKQLALYCGFRGSFSSFNGGFAKYLQPVISTLKSYGKPINKDDNYDGYQYDFLNQYLGNNIDTLSKFAKNLYFSQKKAKESGKTIFMKNMNSPKAVITKGDVNSDYFPFGLIKITANQKSINPMSGKMESIPRDYFYLSNGETATLIVPAGTGDGKFQSYNPYITGGYASTITSSKFSKETINEACKNDIKDFLYNDEESKSSNNEDLENNPEVQKAIKESEKESNFCPF